MYVEASRHAKPTMFPHVNTEGTGTRHNANCKCSNPQCNHSLGKFRLEGFDLGGQCLHLLRLRRHRLGLFSDQVLEIFDVSVGGWQACFAGGRMGDGRL